MFKYYINLLGLGGGGSLLSRGYEVNIHWRYGRSARLDSPPGEARDSRESRAERESSAASRESAAASRDRDSRAAELREVELLRSRPGEEVGGSRDIGKCYCPVQE